MMNKIYVLIAYGGEYDDAWEDNLFACSSHEQAIKEVEFLREQNTRLSAIAQPVINAYYEALRDLPDREEVPGVYPKGPSKPTKENMEKHRQEVLAYVAIANPITARNMASEKNHRLACLEKAKKVALSLGATENDLVKLGFTEHLIFGLSNYLSPIGFKIQELEMK